MSQLARTDRNPVHVRARNHDKPSSARPTGSASCVSVGGPDARSAFRKVLFPSVPSTCGRTEAFAGRVMKILRPSRHLRKDPDTLSVAGDCSQAVHPPAKPPTDRRAKLRASRLTAPAPFERLQSLCFESRTILPMPFHAGTRPGNRPEPEPPPAFIVWLR